MPKAVGQTTITDLTDGTNGTSAYVHIRYSANATGNPMTTVATGALYMGVASTSSATAPTGYASYAWSLIKGADGNNGLPTYTWIKYADDSAGTNMTDTPEGKRYLGLAHNKSTASEVGSVASDYTWSPLYDNVQVGGRNVLTDSRLFTPYSNNSASYPISYEEIVEGASTFYRVKRTSTTLSPTTMSIYNSIPVTRFNYAEMVGKTVTISMKVRASEAINTTLFSTTYGTPVTSFSQHNKVFPVTTEWKTITQTIDVFPTMDTVAGGIRFTPYMFTIPVGKIDTFYVDIREWKIEIGNVHSDWTPALEDKENLYTWIKYATTVTGTSLSDDPTGRDYIGIAYNKDSSVESTNPADYTWSLYRGATGLPSYVHIAYATSADGSAGFSTTVSTGKTYIGTYSDNTLADSASYTAYSWSLIKGADGSAGIDSISGVLSNDAHVVATDSAGNGGVYTGAVSTIKILKGIVDDSANWAVTVAVSGVTGSLSGKTYTVTGLTGDTGYVDFTATRSGYASVVKRFTVTKSKQGTTGSTGGTGLPAYFHVAYANSSDGVTGFSTTVSTGKLFIGTYTDSTVADSASPSAYSWSPLKGDKGDKGDIGDPNTTQITNAVTTINSTGVTVKDGNFALETTAGGVHNKYNVSAGLSSSAPFKNHLFTLPNIFFDHSFEMMATNGLNGAYKHYNAVVASDIFGRWTTSSSPKLYSNHQTDFGIPIIPFGEQMILVNNTNFVRQAVNVVANETYTVSFHLKSAPELAKATQAEVYIKYFDDLGGALDTSGLPTVYSTHTVPTTDTYNDSVRHAVSFTVPNALSNYAGYCEIGFRSVGTGYVCYDGTQLVMGDKPVLYYPDDEAWKIRKGGTDKYPIIDALADGSIRINKLEMSNFSMTNGAKLGLVRDGYEIHDRPMMVQNIVVNVPTANLRTNSVTFTFPYTFASTPVWVLSNTQDTNSTVYKSTVYSATKTGGTVYIAHLDNTLFNGTIEVQIVAMGKI